MIDDIQRGEYLSVRPEPIESVPELAHSGRDSTPDWEQVHWSLEAMAGHLAGYTGRRYVYVTGSIFMFNSSHYVFIHNANESINLWPISLRVGDRGRRGAAVEPAGGDGDQPRESHGAGSDKQVG